MIIYKTTNLINGKIYIGQSINNYNSYLGSGVLIKRALEKYGKENFKKEILCECDTTVELNKNEKFWINYYNSTDINIGYNIDCGGKNGAIRSDLTRKKISESSKGKKMSEESKQKMSESHKGKIPWNKGIPQSEETKKKLNLKFKGKKMSKEFCEKISKSLIGNIRTKGKKLSDEHKKKISETLKKKNSLNK